MTTLGHNDAVYLSAELTIPKLRREIHHAELRDSVARFYADTEYATPDDLWPWADFARVCREAIEIIRASQPKATPHKGRVDPEDIKSRNDILSVVERYIKLRKAGRHFVGICPIHKDSRPSFTVYPENGTWHCYGCNQGGDVISFIQAVEHTDFRGAAAILGASIGT